MTTTATTVEVQEKTIEYKLKALQLTNKNTDKIAGRELLKTVPRHHKLLECKNWGMSRIKGEYART